jgi:hypothetical protein
MKKRKLALLGFAALAGVALASCGGGSGSNTGSSTGSGTGEGTGSGSGSTATDVYYTGGDNASGKCVWNPMSLADAKTAYTVSGDIDLWLVYSKSYGSTYNGVIKAGGTTNPINNQTYSNGDILPAWQEFADKLGISHINQGANYGSNDADNQTAFLAAKDTTGVYKDKNGKAVDLYYNTTTNLNTLGDSNDLVDLVQYLNDGKMPAFKKFLTDNPAVEQELKHNNHIFYTPYMDGYQAIERMYVMDTEQVAKLLDDNLPTGTGNLAAGLNGNEKGLNSTPKAEAFIGKDGKNYDQDLKIKIVNPKDTTKAVEVTVKQTDNILKQQNALLAAGTTGKALIDQFKTYARAAYGDIIDTYYEGKISKMFTSVGACYNTDDLVALLRIFKANPDVLYGSADKFDAVVPVFPRGQADNRVENILNFGATLYGVQGRGSEYDHLFFGADKKIHDFDTTQASYDMLDKLNALYSEGLIQANFWSGSSGTGGLDTYFKKSQENTSSFGLLEYDYTATQSAANDISNGVGTKSASRKTSASGFDFSTTSVTGVTCILSPLTYVSTESFKASQSLDDRTGKTITRYYEENRSVKNTSWAIPKSSDNIDSAIALMDFMFTKEGWEIQNFGPSTFWDYGTVLGEANTPVIKQEILNHFAGTGLDFWNYCRGFLGTTQGIGHYRPTTLDFQATNKYAQSGYTALTAAADLGVQMNSRAVGKASDISWHASMPMAVFSAMDTTTANTYAGVTKFWAQQGKASKDGTVTGWVAIVANGKDYDKNVLTSVNGKDYKYSDVKAECTTKNTSYLRAMGEKMDLVADEAKKA